MKVNIPELYSSEDVRLLDGRKRNAALACRHDAPSSAPHGGEAFRSLWAVRAHDQLSLRTYACGSAADFGQVRWMGCEPFGHRGAITLLKVRGSKVQSLYTS
jgi:hypothetical protein